MSRSSVDQGHNAACLWKGLEISNNVREYEVNMLTNENVIRGKRNFNANCLQWQKPARSNGFTNL